MATVDNVSLVKDDGRVVDTLLREPDVGLVFCIPFQKCHESNNWRINKHLAKMFIPDLEDGQNI